MPERNYYLPGRKLVNQTDASLVASPRVPRSKFLGTWTRKTALDAGILYPIMVDEILPGDHMTYDVTAYVRMSTPLFPLFDNQRIDTHFFFVPARLVWDNWQYMMGSDAPGDTPDVHTIPEIHLEDDDTPIGSIYDHMGIPTSDQFAAGQVMSINALPLRAYNMIWNEWFRDQNLQDTVVQKDDDTDDDPSAYTLLRRNKFHDYFTSALPWPQKPFLAGQPGGPAIPFFGLAPITGIGVQGGSPLGPDDENWLETQGLRQYPFATAINSGGTDPAGLAIGLEWDGPNARPAIFADLEGDGPGGFNPGINVNEFRQAMLLQELLERDARGGGRYIEVIKSHFGVTSLDQRLQRPEYIGGGQTPLTITPIAQTAPTSGAPLGALGAAGTAAGQHHASYAATEHGYVIALLSVRTELSYQQGLHKMWTRNNRYDFYWPALAGLGEQAIFQREIFATGDDTEDFTIFGYQERWQEYRTRLSEVTGIMRSGATGTLDAWHLAQQFSPAPSLNSAFVEDNPPMARVLAAGNLADGQQYLCDIMYRRTAVRPIPTYGIPASLTHF